jgi:thioredoxin 1
VIVVTEDNFELVVRQSKLPVLLDVFGHSCPPCRRIAPLIEELSVELEGRAVVAKLAVEDSPELAVRLGVSAVPTFIVFNDGAETSRLVGIQSKETLLASLGATNFSGQEHSQRK